GGISSTSCDVTVDQAEFRGNAGIALDVQSNALVVRRSLFTENFLGAIRTRSARFDIANNFVFYNGTEKPGGDFGGIQIGIAAPGTGGSITDRLEHNTVIHNYAEFPVTFAGGIYCQGTVEVKNNLICDNTVGDNMQTGAQVAGPCSFSGSTVTAQCPYGDLVSAVPPYDFHIANPSSGLVDGAAPGEVSDDFDGESRPNGDAPDMGADEYYPQ